MSIIGKLMGRDQPGEYTGYVAEIRDRKQAELDEKSTYNRMKKYFRSKAPKDEVEIIANDDVPQLESKHKRIKKYWDSINDAPVVEPAAYVEAEIEDDVKQIARVNQALKKPKSRKREPKEVERDAFDKARAEREAKKREKAIQKAKAKGKYYGSTNVVERTADRAKKVARGGKKVAKAVSGLANEMGETRIGHATKRVMKKNNGRLIYRKVGKALEKNSRLPKSRPVGTRREALPVASKGHPGGSKKGSPSSEKKRSPSGTARKGSPSGTRKALPAGKKTSPVSRKSSHVTRKAKGFGMSR